MPQNDGLKRYFEAALALTQITRSRAEELVRDLIRTGEVESTKAQDWVEDLVSTSRQRSEAFVGTVRTEVRNQLADLGVTSIDELARRVADVLAKAQRAARRSSGGGRTSRPAAKRAPAKKTAKKSAAKRAPAKKSTAKKAAAKKAAARKAPAKKTAKKSAAKRAPARKATARKRA
ncbi:MAG: phasin family protein [Acidimicrobiales bacterium]